MAIPTPDAPRTVWALLCLDTGTQAEGNTEARASRLREPPQLSLPQCICLEQSGKSPTTWGNLGPSHLGSPWALPSQAEADVISLAEHIHMHMHTYSELCPCVHTPADTLLLHAPHSWTQPLSIGEFVDTSESTSSHTCTHIRYTYVPLSPARSPCSSSSSLVAP